MRTLAILILILPNYFAATNSNEPRAVISLPSDRSTVSAGASDQQDQETPEEKAYSVRVNRLQEIAKLMQDLKNDTEALATEAARLCGFVIWTEQREVVAQPLGVPRLGLAITKTELNAYSTMFRNGMRIKLSDLIATIDHLYSKAGIKESSGPGIRKWISEGTLEGNASHEAMFAFLNSLGSEAKDDPNRMLLFNEDPTLDPIQLLVMLRYITEEIRAAVVKAQKKDPLASLLVSTKPIVQQRVLAEYGWFEDAIVVVEQWGQGKVIERALEQALTVSQRAFTEMMDMMLKIAGVGLLFAKVAGVYLCLTGDLSCPDEPLVRTKDQLKGGNVKMVARFKIDASALSDYLKSNRFTFLLLGVDVDSPRSDPLKEVETEWKMEDNSSLGIENIVEFYDANPARVLTDKTGVATIGVRGKGRQQSLANEPVLVPKMKKVLIAVTPQVKATDILQDLVDAAAVAASGPLGILTFISECMFRMKIFGQEKHRLTVKDWMVVRTQGAVWIHAWGRWTKSTSTGTMFAGVNRTTSFEDVQLQDQSLQPPEPIDWSTIPNSQTKTLLKQSYDAQVEASKRLLFIGDKNGTVSTTIRDYVGGRGRGEGCGGPGRYWHTTVTEGSKSERFQGGIFSGAATANAGFMFSVREDQHKVWISTSHTIPVTVTRSGSGMQREISLSTMDWTNGLTFEAPTERTTLVGPLGQTIKTKEVTTWFGEFPFSFDFGYGPFGAGTVEYHVTRRLVNKK